MASTPTKTTIQQSDLKTGDFFRYEDGTKRYLFKEHRVSPSGVAELHLSEFERTRDAGYVTNKFRAFRADDRLVVLVPDPRRSKNRD